MKALAGAYDAEPFPYSAARELMSALGVSEPLAVTLVRRGIDTVEAARAFLEPSDDHDPLALHDMERACEAVEAAIAAGGRITVHGDYDVDGVCSTSILVSTLRFLGAECDWRIPSREEGYGLSAQTVEELAAAGSALLVTVDCGITAADAVARAQELGLGVVVTDHHEPPEELPGCAVVHPALGDYPFGELCGTAVAWKLACALRRRAAGAAGSEAEEADLDLVALATVADMVPLRGENRALVSRGLVVARRARRPGIRALLGVAGCDPAELDAAMLSFRLAPRINAAGRLYRADAGVELMLTADEERAKAIAQELDRANSERRDAELRVVGEAEKALRALPDHLREAPILVVAGEGWHHGVVGIVASRLVEAHGRPAVVITLDGDGGGRGSARGLPPLDLVAALGACSDHLERFGGHKAAAGLSIRADAVDAFREALISHVAQVLGGRDYEKTERVDAVVGGDGLGLALAEELGRLAPFGMGNPEVNLLVPAATLRDVRPMGEKGNHVRFAIASGSSKASAVGFRTGPELPVGPDELCDVAIRLEANRWNGSVEPRAVLRSIRPLGGPPPEAAPRGCPTPDAGAEWWARVEAVSFAEAGEAEPRRRREDREVVVHAPGSVVATVANLASSGASVLAVVADAGRRSALAERAGLERFGLGAPVVVCGHCSAATAEAAAAAGRLVVADWAALRRSGDLAGAFDHVVLVDPPPGRAEESMVGAGAAAPGGFLHRCWGPAEVEFAKAVHQWEWAVRDPLRALWAAIRTQEGSLAGDPLAAALRGPGAHPRTAEQAGRILRVLREAGLGTVAAEPGSLRATLEPSPRRVELEASAAYLEYEARLQEGLRYLTETT